PISVDLARVPASDAFADAALPSPGRMDQSHFGTPTREHHAPVRDLDKKSFRRLCKFGKSEARQIDYGPDNIVRKVDPNGKIIFKGRRFRIGKILWPAHRLAIHRRGWRPRYSFLRQQIGTIDLGAADGGLWTCGTTQRRVAHRVHRP